MEETYKEYKISYDEKKQEFMVSIGRDSYKNLNLAAIKRYIDNLNKKNFKRVDVIAEQYHDDFEDAIVTSYPEGQKESNYKECWVSFKDKSNFQSRRKIHIKSVFLDNAHNRRILAQIQEKKDLIEEITEQIRKLKREFEIYQPEN